MPDRDPEYGCRARLVRKPQRQRHLREQGADTERRLSQYRDGKLCLHRIHACEPGVAPYHPHPWPSAMRILEGTYELTVGCSAGERAPPVAARMIASSAFDYEMIDVYAWHSVRPIGAPAMTVMVTGPRWERGASREDQTLSPRNGEPLAPLSDAEMEEMLDYYRRRYRGKERERRRFDL